MGLGGEAVVLSSIHLLVERLSALRNQRGASGVEYGLLVALIAAAIVGLIGTLGDEIVEAFNTVIDAIGSA
jgi:pilus assembly protein Flp/PilA